MYRECNSDLGYKATRENWLFTGIRHIFQRTTYRACMTPMTQLKEMACLRAGRANHVRDPFLRAFARNEDGWEQLRNHAKLTGEPRAR